jgi:hypothetical protein
LQGAWGAANGGRGLVQLRTLDFGATPFALSPLLTVYHPSDGNTFASLGFPGAYRDCSS